MDFLVLICFLYTFLFNIHFYIHSCSFTEFTLTENKPKIFLYQKKAGTESNHWIVQETYVTLDLLN